MTNKRYAVSRMNDSLDGAKVKQLFAEAASAAASDAWSEDSPLEEKWKREREHSRLQLNLSSDMRSIETLTGTENL